MLLSRGVPPRILNDVTSWRSTVKVEVRPIFHRRQNHW